SSPKSLYYLRTIIILKVAVFLQLGVGHVQLFPRKIKRFGQSGIELAKRAAAFEMEIIAIKRNINHSDKYEFKLAFLGGKNDLDYLLERADFISIHVPLTPETRHLFRKREFQLMKPTAFIINVSRGPIIEKDALHFALKNKLIAGAGLDVFWNEPEDPNDPLFKENVIILPHIAGSTRESHDRMINVIVQNVLRIQQGKEPLHLHSNF
ncbi:MAG: NAD(P)-dependent oxidoreductase, partial [Candidatus Helarchaeota archaeon]